VSVMNKGRARVSGRYIRTGREQVREERMEDEELKKYLAAAFRVGDADVNFVEDTDPKDVCQNCGGTLKKTREFGFFYLTRCPLCSYGYLCLLPAHVDAFIKKAMQDRGITEPEAMEYMGTLLTSMYLQLKLDLKSN